MLSVIYAQYCLNNVAIKPYMLSVIMLNASILIVVAPIRVKNIHFPSDLANKNVVTID